MKEAMKSLLVLAFLFGTLLCGVSRADTSKHVVRIACVPEAGLLDVDSRLLHDSVSSDPSPAGRAARDTRLAESGFHDPHGLNLTCVLGAASYVVTAEQDPTSDRICGGDPEVYLTVTRDGAPFFSNVVFGESCNRMPAVMRFTVGDGPKSWRGRETSVCYLTGKEDGPEHCDWTFGAAAEFSRRFPIDEERVRNIVAHEERR
jgi:hypothetical protein